MNVYVEQDTEQKRWWVHMDDWRASFSTCAEAHAFMERLTARLNAPHSLDLLAHSSLRTGLASSHTPIARAPAHAELGVREAC